MSNWTKELKEEKEVEAGFNQEDNKEIIDHEEVIDMFLKWDRIF
jgi:predicted transcriptional regulator